MDGLNFGEIMSRLAEHRVLILGRFTPRRLAVLKAIAAHLKEDKKFKGKYEPQIFVFAKPKERSLVESILGFAAFSRFVIADLSEPKSIPQELEAIAPRFRSVPIIVRTGKEFATFESLKDLRNIVTPTIRYDSLNDLLEKLDAQVVPLAESRLKVVRPPMPA